MQAASVFSLPIIRAVDRLVGATNAMRVDAWGGGGTGGKEEAGGEMTHVRFSVTHDDLEQCVGLATAAFAIELMHPSDADADAAATATASSESPIDPGVYFPSDLPAPSRRAILERVRRDALEWEFEVTKEEKPQAQQQQ